MIVESFKTLVWCGQLQISNRVTVVICFIVHARPFLIAFPNSFSEMDSSVHACSYLFVDSSRTYLLMRKLIESVK